VSPAARRRAVKRVCVTLEVSERRACRVLGQSRTTQRYKPKVSDDEVALTTPRSWRARTVGTDIAA